MRVHGVLPTPSEPEQAGYLSNSPRPPTSLPKLMWLLKWDLLDGYSLLYFLSYKQLNKQIHNKRMHFGDLVDRKRLKLQRAEQ